ncbi:MAG: hypothetical protein WCA78_00620 [Rhizomicrobium sp.]
MNFAERIAQDRRLAILRLLVEAAGKANESVLREGLDLLGLDAGLTRDAVRADLEFLQERALVKLAWFNDKLAVASITKRGVEVSEGRERIEGIARPSIGE